MTRRQDEAVAIRPVRRGGVELQMPGEKHGRDIGHAHRHPGMAGIGGLNRIHGQRADCGGFRPMFGMLVAQCRNVHFSSFHPGRGCGGDSSIEGKFKRTG